VGGLLLGGRGRLTSAALRRKAIELISEAHAAGVGLVSACSEIGICLRTLKRWRKAARIQGIVATPFFSRADLR
jgi:transposase-like protein